MKDKKWELTDEGRVRQWCLSSAASIIETHKLPSGVSADEVVPLAKILEEYITGKPQPIFAVYPPKSKE